MTLHGKSIWKYHPPRSGLRIGDPAAEEAFAAIWSGDTPAAFADRDRDDQIFTIALYRTHLQIEAVLAHEQTKEQERLARRNKR